jgi:LmbE family N-acetylglucosaminyl deacetylase
VNVLVVAPHPDDEAIGCGGTIIRHAEAGDRVYVAFLTSGELSHKDRPAEEVRDIREREATFAAAVLGVEAHEFLRRPDFGLEDDLDGAAAALAQVIERRNPDRVYVSHRGEWHPDHRAACTITSALAGPRQLEVLTYEVWTPLTEFAEVEDISAQMSRKLEAIGCYSSQLETFDYIRAATGLSQYRGALAARTEYAEVFGDPGEEGPAADAG